jgi:hypothetical protein
MPTTSPEVRPLLHPDVPLVDPKTGKPTQAFYEFIQRLHVIVKQLRTEV